MARLKIEEINVTLERHIAVSNMKFTEIMQRVARIERILIATSGTAIVMLCGLAGRTANK